MSKKKAPSLQEVKPLVNNSKPAIQSGFELLRSRFALSIGQVEALDSEGVDDAIICDFFANYRLEISVVASLARTTEGTVIRTLLKLGIVRDRRRSEKQPSDGIDRRKAKAVSVFPGCLLFTSHRI
jgi:hypothetical protein